MSVLRVSNNTKTLIGKRYLKLSLSQPLIKSSEIDLRLKLIEKLLNNDNYSKLSTIDYDKFIEIIINNARYVLKNNDFAIEIIKPKSELVKIVIVNSKTAERLDISRIEDKLYKPVLLIDPNISKNIDSQNIIYPDIFNLPNILIEKLETDKYTDKYIELQKKIQLIENWIDRNRFIWYDTGIPSESSNTFANDHKISIDELYSYLCAHKLSLSLIHI